MKKRVIVIFLTIIVLLLVMFMIDNYRMKNNLPIIFGTWGKKYTVIEDFNDNFVNCNTSDFEMSLYTDKKEYKSTDKIRIWTTVKYIGNNDEVTIWHAGSAGSDTYLNYLITDGKDFNVQSVSNMMLKSTILKKDKLYSFDYQKSGGWSDDDDNADFWEKFYKEKDLLLPKGEYEIIATGAFSLSDNMKDDVDLICILKIKVI